MKIERLEDIKAWEEARELAKIVYENFKDIKDYGFKVKYSELLFQ
ncbi:hypothetical protein [Deferribacter abyssi]